MKSLINMGKVCITFRGEYDQNLDYDNADMVVYKGLVYICKIPNIGMVPSITSDYWRVYGTNVLPDNQTVIGNEKLSIPKAIIDSSKWGIAKLSDDIWGSMEESTAATINAFEKLKTAVGLVYDESVRKALTMDKRPRYHAVSINESFEVFVTSSSTNMFEYYIKYRPFIDSSSYVGVTLDECTFSENINVKGTYRVTPVPGVEFTITASGITASYNSENVTTYPDGTWQSAFVAVNSKV